METTAPRYAQERSDKRSFEDGSWDWCDRLANGSIRKIPCSIIVAIRVGTGTMRTYVRGNCLLPEAQATLTPTGLKQYWRVDDQGMPVGKPYPRRSDIELHEKLIGDENYEIIARNRGKRPASGGSAGRS